MPTIPSTRQRRHSVRRETDVSKLSFPLQLVVLLISTALTVYGTQAGLRSDIRDISTRMDLAATATEQVRKAEQQTAQLRDAEMRGKVDEIDRRLKLLELQIQAVQQELIKLGR